MSAGPGHEPGPRGTLEAKRYADPTPRPRSKGAGMPDLSTISSEPLETVRENLEEALKGQSFGVLSEIDVQAMDVDRDLALLLPCPVTLREVEGGTEVRMLDPERVFQLAPADQQERLRPLAREVRERLEA